MNKALYVVYSNPVAGKEDEYNRWYDELHLPEVLAVDGFLAAHRYRLGEVQMIEAQPYRYIAIYEINGDDVPAVLSALGAAAPGFNMSDAFDMANMHVAIYDAVGAG